MFEPLPEAALYQTLPQDFYTRADVWAIAQELLGKLLVTRDDAGLLTAGSIVETEAYAGTTDRASHAYGSRHTRRTRIMYEAGGIAYIYLCYGIHHLFNVVTYIQGEPHAILIRAVEPVVGLEIMQQRRGMATLKPNLTAGPGLLTQALGITGRYNGLPLSSPPIWMADAGNAVLTADIVASPRVGVAYAGVDALLPWRYRIRNNRWTSPAK